MNKIAKIDSTGGTPLGTPPSDCFNIMAMLHSLGFCKEGVSVVVDGQYGSTGKGVVSGLLAMTAGYFSHLDVATTNAGPNSGHTAICPVTREPIVTQQLAISAIVYNRIMNASFPTKKHIRAANYLNGGSIIDYDKFDNEISKYANDGGNFGKVYVHPNAAVICDVDIKAEENGGPSKIAGTGKGCGSALARKIMRSGNVAKNHPFLSLYSPFFNKDNSGMYNHDGIVVMEIPQGFSLGLNEPFYPYVTSRSCTVAQGFADANISLKKHRATIMVCRTFPIRVGNTDKGTSGGWYPDQRELSWEELGLEPEITTVTKRVRRIASWSRIQFREAVRVNEPAVVYLNFANYCTPARLDTLIAWIHDDYKIVTGRKLPLLLLGWGPSSDQVSRAW